MQAWAPQALFSRYTPAARATASEPQPNFALPPQRQQQPARTGGYGLSDSESDEEDPGEAVHRVEPSAEVSNFGNCAVKDSPCLVFAGVRLTRTDENTL